MTGSKASWDTSNAAFSLSGLKVEGVYRRCGVASKVSQLVEALIISPNSAPLESHEQGVLDAGSALKQYVRRQESLIPNGAQGQWLQAAGTRRTTLSYYYMQYCCL